jgi:Protein of unknown function DUF104
MGRPKKGEPAMSFTIEAIYENGVLKIAQPLQLPALPGTTLAALGPRSTRSEGPLLR